MTASTTYCVFVCLQESVLIELISSEHCEVNKKLTKRLEVCTHCNLLFGNYLKLNA